MAAFQGGATHVQLAARFGIAKATVIAHLKRAGVGRPRIAMPAEQLEELARLYRNGDSLATIGARFRLSPKTVWTGLNRAGVPIRPRRGWPYPST